MGKSLMPEVAKILGVEINEEFKIKRMDGLPFTESYFKITEAGFQEAVEGEVWNAARGNTMDWLLAGRLEVERLPWVPKYGEEYHHIGFRYDGNVSIGGCTEKWEGTSMDYAFLQLGLIHRTWKECEKYLKRDYKKLTGKEWRKAK